MALPEKIYVLRWVCKYAGGPVDQDIEASLDQDDPKFARLGEETYDGVYMATEGRFCLFEVSKPKSIGTLEKKLGDRVLFGLTKSKDVGCWIDGKPHRLDTPGEYVQGQWMPDGNPRWTWNTEERAYLEALARLRDEYE